MMTVVTDSLIVALGKKRFVITELTISDYDHYWNAVVPFTTLNVMIYCLLDRVTFTVLEQFATAPTHASKSAYSRI